MARTIAQASWVGSVTDDTFVLVFYRSTLERLSGAFHGYPTGDPRETHGIPTGVLWGSHGSSMGNEWATTRNAWETHGRSMDQCRVYA